MEQEKTGENINSSGINLNDNVESQKLSKHQEKELKRQQRENEGKKSNESKNKKELMNKTLKYSSITLIIILALVGGYYFIIKPINNFKPYTSGPVHWHANFEVDLCGVKQDFTKGYDFESNGKGNTQFHSHNDGIIHVEAQVAKKEDLALGNFFDAINIPFSGTRIMNKKNGDLCPNGASGKVYMYVNDIENYGFRNFTINPCDSPNIAQDCDHIKIKFE